MRQRGLGSHTTHGTRPGLKTILSQTCDKIVCTFQIKYIFLLLYLLSFYPLFFGFLMFWLLSVGPLFPTYSFSYYATNRKVAGSIPDDIIGIFRWRNPSVRTMTLGSTQSLIKMRTRRISWWLMLPVRMADKTYQLPVPSSWNLETLNSWKTLGHSRPLTGLLYL